MLRKECWVLVHLFVFGFRGFYENTNEGISLKLQVHGAGSPHRTERTHCFLVDYGFCTVFEDFPQKAKVCASIRETEVNFIIIASLNEVFSAS